MYQFWNVLISSNNQTWKQSEIFWTHVSLCVCSTASSAMSVSSAFASRCRGNLTKCFQKIKHDKAIYIHIYIYIFTHNIYPYLPITLEVANRGSICNSRNAAAGINQVTSYIHHGVTIGMNLGHTKGLHAIAAASANETAQERLPSKCWFATCCAHGDTHTHTRTKIYIYMQKYLQK